MSIFKFLTKFLIFWHPWYPWVCIRSDLIQIWAIPPTVRTWVIGISCKVIFPRSSFRHRLRKHCTSIQLRRKRRKKKTKFPQGIVESGKNAPGNHHLSKKQNLFFHREVQQRNVEGSYLVLVYFSPKNCSLKPKRHFCHFYVYQLFYCTESQFSYLFFPWYIKSTL